MRSCAKLDYEIVEHLWKTGINMPKVGFFCQMLNRCRKGTVMNMLLPCQISRGKTYGNLRFRMAQILVP